MTSLKRGKPYNSQSREIIFNVYQFMSREATESKNMVFRNDHFQNLQERTAKATGVSRRTISAVLKEHDNASASTSSTRGSTRATFSSPKKSRKKKEHRANLDGFDYDVIRRKMYDFHVTEKRLPTIKSLLNKLQEDMNFTGSRETLRRILLELGFKFKKMENNRSLLAEKDEVRLQRIKYLRQIQKFRSEGRDKVYTDETYIHATHTKESSWADSSKKGLKKPISKGERLIIVHAGSSRGFVPGALLVYKSSQSTGDYHHEMNKENYEKWLKQHLIPNLRPNTVVVVDNASYHNTRIDNAPNSNSLKASMQSWLTSKNIPFASNLLKPELYEIIKRHKSEHIKYSIDQIMAEHGHSVLRLPPYHPDFNPIENIWAQVKGHVSSKNVSMNLTKVKELLIEKFESIGVSEWEKVVDHAIKCEKEHMRHEDRTDRYLDQFIINLNDSSSDSDESFNDYNRAVETEDISMDVEGVQQFE